jgi:hypothetical protein
LQATGLTAQSYRKVVTTARRDKKLGTGPKGLTEEQKQEIRYEKESNLSHNVTKSERFYVLENFLFKIPN